MNTTKLITSAVVAGAIVAGAVSSTALAWHPKGVITKYVQNVTTGSQMADANTAVDAVSTKPGDLVTYTITIENTGTINQDNSNDMYFTKLTDTLPAGVELASNPSKRVITEDIGIVKAGQKVTKQYTLKVTSTKDGDIITNTACFTGDSEVKDNPQSGCNPAVITVTVPKTPETPKENPKEPEQPRQEQPVAKLADTGPGNFLVPAGLVTGLGYAGNLLRLKRRASKR